GHIVSEGILKPEPGKVRKILDIAKPVSKRQVRSLQGPIGYYRRYVPNFATLTAPLSDLTRADRPRKITWIAECDDALRAIQRILASFPVLLIPDLSKEFIVRTDASSSGLGAVLLQDKEGLLHPVAFVSRKLLDRETRYSTIQRECLAIVWSLTKLSRYLWGLGHIVFEGILKPEPGKVRKILDIAKPVSKRQVRSLQGPIGYYRRYVPNFATLTAPLSDLTRADRPRKITWIAECDDALRAIQRILASFPVLLIPDLSKEFIVRTDASNSGLGAVLLQDKEGLLHPVAFVSRKLLDRETRYSTIQRECLAIVWSLTKLSRYLWG
ncbi:hypothetical protein BaRGS_00006704, partial [Batillaria attramentaria]